MAWEKASQDSGVIFFLRGSGGFPIPAGRIKRRCETWGESCGETWGRTLNGSFTTTGLWKEHSKPYFSINLLLLNDNRIRNGHASTITTTNEFPLTEGNLP